MRNDQTVAFVQADCAMYDELHAKTRRVIREAPISFPCLVLETFRPDFVQFSHAYPTDCARLLKKFLVEKSAQIQVDFERTMRAEMAKYATHH